MNSNNRLLITLFLIIFFVSINESYCQFRNGNIKYITFWEKTSPEEPHPYSFSPVSRELMNRIEERPNAVNADFIGWNEFYDVFYSDKDGNFDVNGDCISIEAIFDYQYPPYDGGLNICEVQLTYVNGNKEFASRVTSYNAVGNNASFDSINNIVDGKLESSTKMGNTSGSSERLRVTVGFSSIAAIEKKEYERIFENNNGTILFHKLNYVGNCN